MSDTEAETVREPDLDLRDLRKAALDAAIRCAQPGTHAEFVMGDAKRFLNWLRNGE